MWQLITDEARKGVIRASVLAANNEPLSFAEVFELWRSSQAFQTFWVNALRDIEFAAYCWETPALTRVVLTKPFESVFVDNPELAATQADASPFEEHFRSQPNCDNISFKNLGGDALLIAPCPQQGERDAYSHLARFMREAPEDQATNIWLVVAAAIDSILGESPLWLSTAGLGVYWLHIRLDSRPKYYRYRAYRDADYLQQITTG
mgnify:CR=1 FL=1